MYSLDFSKRALSGIKGYKKFNPSAYKKIEKILLELSRHPREGTGHPESLKGFGGITWSRHIDKKNRLIYDIYDEKIMVLIVEVEGHYKDK